MYASMSQYASTLSYSVFNGGKFSTKKINTGKFNEKPSMTPVFTLKSAECWMTDSVFIQRKTSLDGMSAKSIIVYYFVVICSLRYCLICVHKHPPSDRKYDQGPEPIPLAIFPSQRQFDVNCSNPNTTEGIATKFCTWHDSIAAVACAKFCSDLMVICSDRAGQIFYRS